MSKLTDLNKTLSYAKKQIGGCTFLSAYKTSSGEEKFKIVLKIKGKKEELFVPKTGSLPGGFTGLTPADIIQLISVVNEYKSDKDSLQ